MAVIVVTVFAASLLAGAYTFRSSIFGVEDRAITAFSMTLLKSLSENRLEDALAVCPEGSSAGQLLYEEERRVFKPGEQVETAATPEAAQKRIDGLALLRKELESQGVSWSDVRPVAFGGVRARVLDPQRMRAAATALTGNIFFSSGGRVFAVEVSAWRCDGQYVLLDVWQGAALPTDASDVGAYSKEQYREFQKESGADGEGAEIERAKHIYVRMPS
ncbi:MAG: hypothetical protein K1Y02_00380 [Candidatus Hydrogenedentes bacterium]|nr:hypothetical protein [Candidatus Hydrogenedentota bacterium]